MGIKEQTVSVHIRGSYRYRRAPYNRNRRSKHAPVSFPLRRLLLLLVLFRRLALAEAATAGSGLARKKSLPTCSPITQYYALITTVSRGAKEIGETQPETGVRSVCFSRDRLSHEEQPLSLFLSPWEGREIAVTITVRITGWREGDNVM